jgi:hypothetical protein
LVLRVFSRLLDRDKEGIYRDADCGGKQGDAAAVDHMWITREEVQALLKAASDAGVRSGALQSSFEMPATITERLLRFHLIDNTRGEPPMWRREHIRQSKAALTTIAREASKTDVRLEGRALLATASDTSKADRGYDVRLVGEIRIEGDRVTQFRVVAVGDHWGEGTFTRGARPGRTPLGIAFELADGRQPGDSVPPQAAREVQEYFGAAFRR